MKQLHRRSIAELKAAMAGGVSASTVTEEFLVRIQHRDGELRAFTALDPEVARAAAAESAARYAAGCPRPLEGVPVAVKANIAIAGLPTLAGMDLLNAPAAGADAAAVTRLRAAGAVVLGHLAMHEAAMGATNDNPFTGRTMNPHRAGFTPGGSSGGSGAAVAAGLCVAALGTDTLGSIRIPAAYCGVYGLKPTNGLVSVAGVVPLSGRFDCVGPLARSIDDLEQMIEVLADLAKAAPISVVATVTAIDRVPVEPAVTDAYRRSIALLAGLDVEMRAIDLPIDLDRVRLAGFATSAREFAASNVERADRFSPEVTANINWAARRSDAELSEAGLLLDDARQKLLAVLHVANAILMPTTPTAAFAHGSHLPTTQARFTALANVAGLPALTLPSGSSDGMPIGVQLVGRPGSERALIAIARRLDQALRGYAPPPDFA